MRGRLRAPFAPLLEHEQLLMISISTVLVMAGQGVISPVLPLFAEEFGVSIAAIGLTLSFFGLARLILNVPLGVLSDRYGRRLLLVAGPLITAVGMVGSGLAGGLTELLAWRFVAGAGSAMYMTGAQIYLADISSPATRARFIGTNQSALLLGVSVGPALGGLIAEIWDLRMPFFVVGAGALVATVYAYWRLPETRHLAQAEIERVEPGGSPSGERIVGTARRLEGLPGRLLCDHGHLPHAHCVEADPDATAGQRPLRTLRGWHRSGVHRDVGGQPRAHRPGLSGR